MNKKQLKLRSVQVRLSMEDYETLEKKAIAIGQGVSTFVRTLVRNFINNEKNGTK